MKILVCLKEVFDPALSLDFGLKYDVVFREGRPLRLNPDDVGALAAALDLKENHQGAEIILVSIGSPRVESYLRNGLALGAGRAVRINAEKPWEDSPYHKARLLAAAASLYDVDLVLTGAASLDTGHGLVGEAMAARLGLPCITRVTDLELEPSGNSVIVLRDIGRGEREKVRCALPAVVTVKGERRLPYASLDSLLSAHSAEIEVLAAADLGLSPAVLEEEPVRVAGPVFPRPRPGKAPRLDTSLPAFYRILQLLEGGITRREGRLISGGPDEVVEQLFNILKEEGVLRSAGGV